MQDSRKRNVNKNISEKNSVGENVSERKNNDISSSKNNNLSLRVISRSVVIFSLLIIVYFSSNDDKTKPFAKQSEILTGKGQVIECSSDYLKELDKYEGCFPKQCKRFVSDKVISEREADELLTIAKKGLQLGGSSGGASILDLHSGALSMGEHFINIYKIAAAKNTFSENDFNIYRVVKEKVKYAVAHHFGVNPNKIYLTHPTFFSEITSKKSVTVHDEYWHPHVDKETYKSFHYTTLLYLGDYNKDFKGGRFVFVDENVNKTVEPRKARLSMFTSGSENLHYVEKVTSGVRYAVTISFTCDKQHAIENPSTDKYKN
ncbi:2-oxoglutarate and iron-dependent oxygenase domain-containing protein 3-like [Galleria mellonella]|uniref:2-oxoglutarate and iron-dependent oxygenase domain-containing protein 3-like n=1 Tax=Galleria mellonella TaxID=7137 RepID=A0A6J1WAQ0_GALME|nr:2-oxoglutarate and iron-dependent oxygenase domain-containing protein 3-like [Galleria mellonella]